MKLRERSRPGLVQVTRIPGPGPQAGASCCTTSWASPRWTTCKAAAEAEQLRTVAGFGAKAEENVLAALAAGADGDEKPRTLLSKALEVGEAMVDGLREHPAAIRVELAGSARRWAETCKDLDIVASAEDPAALIEAFKALEEVDEVQRVGHRRRPGDHRPGHPGGPADRARGQASATCSSTSPARAATTRRCARRR